MTETSRYQFRGERVQAALVQAAQRVTIRELEEAAGLDEGDLEGAWDDLVEEDSDSVMVLTEATAADFANRVVAGDFAPDVYDPRHGAWHAAALQRLAEHDNCGAVIGELIAQRNDVLASIMYARDYCFNDIYEGEYGDLCVNAEDFLSYLRPALQGSDYCKLLQDHCSKCDLSNFNHEEWCTADNEAERLASERQAVVATHLHCTEMAQALIGHISLCIAQAEEIAHQARVVTVEAEGVAVLDPHEVLPTIQLHELNQPLEPLTPAALATAIQPPLEDKDYCDEEDHSDPHRACRYLIS